MTAVAPLARSQQHRHQPILDAALDLLAEAGYDRMTMDAVAARAKASKATIYRYWPGKPQLVAEAMHCRADATDLPDSGSLRGDLRAFVGSACAAMASSDGALFVELLSASLRDPELGEVMRTSMIEAKATAMHTLLVRAQQRGELTADADLGVVLELLPGALLYHLLVLGNPPTDAFADHLVDDILLPLVTRRS